MREYKTFEAFWPYYLGEHANPATRIFHYVGSTLAILILIAAILTQNWWALLAVPFSGYFFAWISHAFIEHNKPATWTYPLWSLVADYRMYGFFLMGKLDGELEKAGISTSKASA